VSSDEWLEIRGFVALPPDSPPPGAEVKVEFGAQSRRGALRSVNEDHFLIVRLGRNQETLMTSLPEPEAPRRFDEYAYGMVVADGVGGTGAGEAASRLAITTLAHLVIHFGRWNLRIDDDIAREVMARAERFYRKVDSTLLHRSSDRAGLRTTLTAVYTAGRDLFVVHVGHSRAYLLRGGQLIRLTRDHTLADEPAAGTGPLLDIAASVRDLHHILTEIIGSRDLSGPMIDIERHSLEDGDVVLLCTNGLTDVVAENQIVEVLQSDRSCPEQSGALINLAVEAGTDDDVTAVVARYRIPEEGADVRGSR
jgi:serine/threonine protein phosphatase PrpC